MELQLFTNLKSLVEQAASELAYAKDGRDEGLLPLNNFLQQIHEFREQSLPLSALADGIAAARDRMDQVFMSTGTFSANAIAQFRSWLAWFETAVEKIHAEEQIAPYPPFTSDDEPAAALIAQPVHCSTDQTEKKLVLNLESDGDLIREFVQESGEHLQAIEQGVLVLETDPRNADSLNTIFRAFHTFKGGAGFLNLAPIHDLAHELESLLDRARQGKLIIDSGIADIILEGGDCLKSFSGRIAARLTGEKNNEPILVPTAALLKKIRAVLNGEYVASASKAESPNPSASEVVSASVSVQATTVKVDTLKFDGLIDSVGEMVIAQSLVAQNAALRSLRDEELIRNLAELARITSDLQRTAMSLRMVPIRPTFQKMQRVVRDLAAKIGKKINLVTEGDETELDRIIVEEISDPLIHMVRNSVDHGVEMPAVRVSRGKPECGTLSLRGYHQAGNIVIEIKDDGNGLNREAILAKALEKGLVSAAEKLSDNDIFNLIFAPGFSTATQVTELSGRGVGMDVVRRNIQKLRGKIEIESQPGKGATFRIYLPLTLAIIDGLVVGLADRCFILPTLSVIESFQPKAGAIKTIHGKGEVIEIRGGLRRVIRLNEVLDIKPTSADVTQCIAVAVEAVGGIYCLLVETLIGKQEVVIKSMGEIAQKNPCVVGATILGDSRLGLILDVHALATVGRPMRKISPPFSSSP